MDVVQTATRVGIRLYGLAQAAADAAGGAARGLASLPRLIDVLDRLADETVTMRKLAQSAPALDRLAEGIQLLEQALESGGLQPLAEAVTELNKAVATLNATISPLQGTAERLGRLVDRFPARGRREPGAAIAPPFVAPTDS